MANQPLQIVKTVSSLPVPLKPNTIYLVRVGQGYDLYATDTTGSSAYKINVSPSQLTSAISIANGGTGASTLAEAQEVMGISDNKVLNPIKIGAKWYQTGLRYSAEYPRDYNPATMAALSGYQMWVPFVALENATINNLEILCTTAVASSTVQLGLYSSDANNDLSGAIFISGAISCATTGAKIAPCSIAIQKGKVYWLSSLTTGTPSFNRSYSDSLQAIKGAVNAGQANTIGYAIANMTTMPVTPPTNKVDRNGAVPRVAFSTL